MQPRTGVFIFLAVNLILIILAATEARGYEFFTQLSRDDLIRQGAFTVLACIDWQQTKDFRERGGKEKNQILGREPSQQTVDEMIGAGIIAHVLFTWFLPPEFRKTWQVSFILIEGVTVLSNEDSKASRLSIRIPF